MSVSFIGAVSRQDGEVLAQLVGGLQSGTSCSGAHSLDELHAKAIFVRMTPVGSKESLLHDVQVS